MSERCDVIIPVKDVVWWVDWCLGALFRNSTTRERRDVFVVDDSSSPESLAALMRICARFDGVRLVRNGGRPGFGGACNFGASLSAAPYLLFLNTDCLITPRTLGKLLAACASDARIGMACPVSNNSPALTLPMFQGRSYLQMNELLERSAAGRAPEDIALDACTVVGNCLLISKECFDANQGFDYSWGAGYGEETDFQFRAMKKGFRGVAAIDTYVFHFGSATFRHRNDFAALQARNYWLFFERWGESYRAYAELCRDRDPLTMLGRHLEETVSAVLAPQVLFLLPGVSETVSGVQAAVRLCNHLIRHGVDAACAILGDLDSQELGCFTQPLLFGLLNLPDDGRFYAQRSVASRMLLAPCLTTAPPAAALSRSGVSTINFVQNYKFYHSRGALPEVGEACLPTDAFLITSAGLERSCDRTPPRLDSEQVRALQIPLCPDLAYMLEECRVGWSADESERTRR